jgi:hypothetical protein
MEKELGYLMESGWVREMQQARLMPPVRLKLPEQLMIEAPVVPEAPEQERRDKLSKADIIRFLIVFLIFIKLPTIYLLVFDYCWAVLIGRLVF